MEHQNVTVSALTKYLKYKFDNDKHLQNVRIFGEVSNVKIHNRKHIYFSLKDDFSKINGVMFAKDAAKLNFDLKDGMAIVVVGNISVFEVSGTYQVYAKTFELSGSGELQKQFELLKREFESLGYFDQSTKANIPKIVKSIGIVTASDGAAITDFQTSVEKHIPHVNTILYKTLVQGERAPKMIAEAIKQANTENKVEVLIVGRGGGSLEDLWAFNTRIVVEAINSSKIPIISAVGHEIDVSLSDFAADLRVATPTASIYYFLSQNELRTRLGHNETNLELYIMQTLQQIMQNIRLKHEKLQNVSPQNKYNLNTQKLENTIEKLNHINIGQLINTRENDIIFSLNYLEQTKEKYFSREFQKVEMVTNKLEILNPLNQLKRGYALVLQNDKVITQKKEIKAPELTIQFSDGTLDVEVKKDAKKE